MATAINKLEDTAVGKSLKVFLWTAGSYAAYIALTLAVTWLKGVHYNTALTAAGAPLLLNWIGVTLLNLFKADVPNLPSSTPMQLVPVFPPAEPVVVTPTAVEQPPVVHVPVTDGDNVAPTS